MSGLRAMVKGDNPFILCSILVVLGFIVRILMANAQIIAPDGLLYIKIAKGISSGNLQSITDYGFFNLYSFLIALFQTVLRDWELSGKIVSVVFGTLTIIPLFYLIKGLFNQNMAIVSVLFYAVHPRFIELSSDVLREPTCWFFSIIALWLAWEGLIRNRYAFFVVSSLSAGFAMVTRLEGAVIFAVIILWILLILLNSKGNRKRILIYLCIFLFSLPILMSPFFLVLKNKTNRWELGHPIEKIAGLVIVDEEAKEPESALSKDLSIKTEGFQEIAKRHQYALFALEVFYKFFKAFNIVLLVFFLYGIWRRRFIGYSRKDVMIAIWLIATFCSLFLYVMKVQYLSSRHALFMVLPALAWVGVGFFEIRERIRRWFGGTRLFQKYAQFDTIFLLIFILIILFPQTVFSLRNDKVELKKAGIELKKMGFSNTTFIVQPTLNRVAFYADAEFLMLPDKIDSSAMKALLAQHRSTLLIIDERTVDDYVTGIRKIIEQSKFQKLRIPEMDQYRKYSFSIYIIQ